MHHPTTAKAAQRVAFCLLLCLVTASMPRVAAQTPQQVKELAEADRLNSEVVRLHREGRYSEAVSLAERALAIREKALGAEHQDVATSLNNLARLYEEVGEYEKAAAHYERSIKAYEKAFGVAHPAVAAPLHNLAELYSRTGEYELAEPLFLRAISTVGKILGPDHPNVATSSDSLALLYRAIGEYDKSEQYFRRALAIREKAFGAESRQAAETLAGLAVLNRDRGDYGESERLFLRTISVIEKSLGPEHPRTASYLNSYAILLRAKTDYAGAEAIYRRVLAIREKVYGAENAIIAETLNNIGLLYNDRGDTVKAEQHYLRALEISERVFGRGTERAATTLNNLAELYRRIGDYEKAEEYYARALAAYEKAYGPDSPNTATIINNYALYYNDRGDFARAESLYRRALQIIEKAYGPEHPLMTGALAGISRIYKARGDYARAEPLYLRVLAADEKALGPDHPEVAGSLASLASLYEAKGEPSRAVEMMERAEEVREKNVARILFSGSEQQKLLYLDTLAGAMWGVISLHLRSAPTDERAARIALLTLLRRKGRALDAMAEQVSSLRRRLDPQDRELLNRLADTQSRLSALVLGSGGSRAEIERLETERERLQDSIARRSAEFQVQTAPVTLDLVRQALPEEAALVEFVSYAPFNPKARSAAERFGPEHYAAYVLKRDGELKWVDLGEGDAIDKAVWRLREALKDPKREDVRELARAVEERVMRPVRKLLGASRRVFVSPDGTLNLVPFAALVDESGKYLVESYTLTYLTSGRDLMRLKVDGASRQSPLVVADPHFGEAQASAGSRAGGAGAGRSAEMAAINFGRLLGTAEEAKAISTVLPEAKILTETHATEAALKQVAGPRILHVATHGFFLPDQPATAPAEEGTRGIRVSMGDGATPARAENPLLRSGLALEGANHGSASGGEDGILTALEAAALDLWGTKLVVLSACETGLGELRNGEGVFGLRRALVLAGSESQVMSLWQVSDAATKMLMVGYYERLGAGEGRTDALRRVQLAMLKGDAVVSPDAQRGLGAGVQQAAAGINLSHPYFWAGFIQSGDWRPMGDVKK